MSLIKNALGAGALVTVSFGLTMPNSASASEVSFKCDQYDGFPASILLLREKEIPTFVWKSNYFEKSGYTNHVRCREVTGRLNEIFEDGTPWFTSGEINGWPVICTAKRKGEDCSKLVYTLKLEQDPEEVLDRITGFNISEVNASDPLYESSSCPLYVGLDKKEGQLVKSRACEPEQGILQKTWSTFTNLFK